MKRKRDVSLASPPSSLNDLPNSLLVDIFRRLPLFTAHRCKLVCKLWHSLISEPSFGDQFFHNKNRCTLLGVYYFESACKIYFLSNFESSAFASGLSLSFMTPSASILFIASSKDLLLCRELEEEPKEPYHMTYTVCNPVTREWVRFPRDDSLTMEFDVLFIGFTSKTNGEFAIFKVMRPKQDEPYNFYIKVFYSSTSEWIETVHLCPERIKDVRFLWFIGVSCNEQLFWLDTASGTVLGIDIFNISTKGPSSWFFIDPPEEFISNNANYNLNNGDYDDYNSDEDLCNNHYHLGVGRGGNLRLCQISKADLILRVWDLKDSGEWFLHSQVTMRDVPKKFQSIKCCDPNDPNAIYITDAFQGVANPLVCSFNLNTGKIKPVYDPCPTAAGLSFLNPYEFQWQPTRLLISNQRI